MAAQQGFRKLNYLHAKRVEAFLGDKCKSEDGAALYEPGWDDEEVARMLVRSSEDLSYITANHVASIRRMVIGKLRRGRAPNEPPDMEELLNQFRMLSETVDELSARMAPGANRYISELGSRVAKLEARFKRLADSLGEHYDD